MANLSAIVPPSGVQAPLISGTNIKTVNSQNLLGSGNITISTSYGTTQEISTNTNAVAGTIYVITASLTLTLPANPTNDQISFINLSGTTTGVIGLLGLS